VRLITRLYLPWPSKRNVTLIHSDPSLLSTWEHMSGIKAGPLSSQKVEKNALAYTGLTLAAIAKFHGKDTQLKLSKTSQS
jgi:hypothetical protein